MVDRIILSFISFLFLHFVYDFKFSFRCYLCINLLVLMTSLDAEIWELQISTEFQLRKLKIK